MKICKTICFVDSDWSLFARPIEMDRVHVLWSRALGKLFRTEGSLSRDEISRIERELALALPAGLIRNSRRERQSTPSLQKTDSRRSWDRLGAGTNA